MMDQLKYLNSVGVKSTSLGLAVTDEEKKSIEKGEFSIVNGSPESWMADRWQKMLGNPIYSKELFAVAVDEAHVISHW